jgi:hypothetical protein
MNAAEALHAAAVPDRWSARHAHREPEVAASIAAMAVKERRNHP